MTETSEQTPSPLETLILQGMNGQPDESALVAELLNGEIFLPSAEEVQKDGTGIMPLQLKVGGSDIIFIAAFTDMRHIDEEARRKAPYCIKVPARWLIKSMNADLGLILFAGPGAYCNFAPEGLAQLRTLITD